MISGFGDQRLIFPATQRNRVPIGNALAEQLPSKGLILELASGSGEHGVTFQKRFPDLIWQCSDPDPEHCRSINAWIRHEQLTLKMPAALQLDVRDTSWLQQLGEPAQAVVAINLLHISAWNCTTALFKQSAAVLPSGGTLCVYGPFSVDGHHVSESNRSFDASLRERNPSWGVRDQTTVLEQAMEAGLALQQITLMPANNRLITWVR
ncbi:hypothetical protein SynBIOSU31_01351 [Synechococcus sp. BIOS-U3-1]|uniref:DUF938 domain-containing protein n=1 Tax=Synechococcus sp. BIOS-U3-1 TaxID=1400865 RepID=UPI00164752AA|nr:DUF938 domain-containing protein [Synechococcus sp. BIOS-U3-1]QNI58226.1 hypothetical protein SynBIOSU31_01351 [Synechococcus sp. BIOS-U3-1]|tara:strand:+ start:618 stop:1241 length:624 start_codon:yes stop_codon:yes gene_type:complete